MYFPLLLYFLEIFYVVIFKALAVNTREQTSFIWPLQVTTYHNLFIVSYIFFICLFYTNKEFLDVSKTFPFYSWRQNDVEKWLHLSLYVVQLRNSETFSALVWTSQKHRLPSMSCGLMGTCFSCRPGVDDGWSIWQ